jgi:hypothetical protein
MIAGYTMDAAFPRVIDGIIPGASLANIREIPLLMPIDKGIKSFAG